MSVLRFKVTLDSLPVFPMTEHCVSSALGQTYSVTVDESTGLKATWTGVPGDVTDLDYLILKGFYDMLTR